MISYTTKTVEDFFQEADWWGLKPVAVMEENFTTVVTEEINEVDFNLTVENFFALNNWLGIPQVKTVKIQQVSESPAKNYPPVYPLKMTVEEFFLRMVWQGQNSRRKPKNIASAPLPRESDTLSNLNDNSINVNDLSDLF